MKNLTKKLLSVMLSLAVFTTCVPAAFAMQAQPDDPYAELKEAIYRQLEAQGALQHYELHLAALIPQEDGISPMSTSSRSWRAPNGGILCYTYDWTYRNEKGYVDSVQTYLDYAATTDLLNGELNTVDNLLSLFYPNPLDGIPILGQFWDIIGYTNFAMNMMARNSINQAGGYARISTVYDSISGGSSTTIVGWESYPTATLNRDDAYNVTFVYG